MAKDQGRVRNDVGEAGKRRWQLVGSLSDDFCVALGRVTANFSLLEEELKIMATALINPKDQQLGEIITAEIPFRGVVGLVSALFAHRCDDVTQRRVLDDILTRAMQVEARRNAMIHSEWLSAPGPEERIRIKTTAKKKTGLQHHTETMKAADISAIADQASELASEVLGFLAAVKIMRLV